MTTAQTNYRIPTASAWFI